jgi:hypothetical protein
LSGFSQGLGDDAIPLDVRVIPTPRSERRISVATSVLAQPRKVFAIAFVLVFLNMFAWSLATPLFAAPDENAHVIHAAAVVRGQIIGAPIHGSSFTSVTVPALIADGDRYPRCFGFKIGVPASCARPLTTNTRPVVTTTPAGRYPPLYYAIVGLPSLLTVSTTGIYLMRTVSALICALFIALAVVSVTTWSRRSFLLVGVLLALTPMTLYLGGVVNPNGPEICEAICVWTSGLILVLERAEAPPRGLVVILVASTAALVVTRGLSPLWVVLICLVLVFLSGRRTALDLLRSRSLRIPIAVVVVVGIAAVVWILAVHANELAFAGAMLPAHESAASIFFNIFGYTGAWIQQMIGVFGWLDTPSPLATYLIWYAAVGFVVLLALGCSTPRGAFALLGMTAIVVFVPVIISYQEVHRLGIVWQGRYMLAMAVGIPILSTALIDAADTLARFRARMTVIVCICVGIGDFAAFLTSQRRYASGLPGPINPANGTWGPPLGNSLVTVWSLVATALLVGATAFVVSRRRTDDERSVRPTSTSLSEGPPPPLDPIGWGGLGLPVH